MIPASGIAKLHVSYFPGAYLTSFTGLNFSFAPCTSPLYFDFSGK